MNTVKQTLLISIYIILLTSANHFVFGIDANSSFSGAVFGILLCDLITRRSR